MIENYTFHKFVEEPSKNRLQPREVSQLGKLAEVYLIVSRIENGYLFRNLLLFA